MSRTTLDTAALAHDLRLAVMRLSRRLRNQRVDTSVTLTHLAALSTLKRHGPMSPGELAAHERVQPPSMTRVVVALEGMGLVTRTPHPTDGRQVVIGLDRRRRGAARAEARAREAWLTGRLQDLSARGARRAPRGRGHHGQAGQWVTWTSTDQNAGTERRDQPATGMFRALRVRNFRLYASAQPGQPHRHLDAADRPGLAGAAALRRQRVALGLITALQFGPTLLLSMYGGVLADRYAKRRLLVITQALMGVLALLPRHPGRHRRRRALARVRAGRRAWARSRPSTPRCGRRSSPRWSARTCWPTPSASTRRSSTAPAWSGPAIAGLLIAAASGNTAPAFFINAASFAFTIARAGRHAGRRAAAEPAGRPGQGPAAGGRWPTPGRTPTWCWRWCWPSSSARSASTTR